MYGAGGGVQSDNRSEEVKALIRDADRLAHTVEINPAFGGPILRNRLWFFGAVRLESTKNYVADVYLPDGSQAYWASLPNPIHSELLRLTAQVTERNKLRISFDKNTSGREYASVGPGVLGSGAGATRPEAAYEIHIPQAYAPQAKLTSTISSRVLFEAGLSTQYMHWRHQYRPTVGPFEVAHIEQTTGVTSVATTSRYDNLSNHFNLKVSLSYVTGSHNFKSGITHRWGFMEQSRPYNGDVQALRFLYGQPTSVTVLNTPVFERDDLNADVGLFVQDNWTLRRFTFNLGGRFDRFNSSLPEQTAQAGNFVPERRFGAVDNLPNFNDWAVRFGVSYDLFGTGKTALKANVARFVGGASMEFTSPYNPMVLQTDQRSWRDLDGNGTVFDPNGRVQYEEIGPTRNLNFGFPSGTRRLDPELPRDGNWEQSVLVQHELRPGISVTGGYYRRQFYNLTWIDNLLVDPERDYGPFTIVAPRDPRLPNGGGEAITLYNLNPDKLGHVSELVTASPANRRAYNGFEITADARFANGAFLFGGVTTERTAARTCQVDNPNQRRFCDNVPPFRTMIKLSGTYPLPYGVQVSGSLSMLPGTAVAATYAINSALAGIPLTGGGTLDVPLVEPNTMFLDHVKQLDLRLMRVFQFGRTRVRALMDIYNVLNASTVTTVNQTFGPNWLRPTAIMQGRYLRFGTQIDF
jgi:hypothetical protein